MKYLRTIGITHLAIIASVLMALIALYFILFGQPSNSSPQSFPIQKVSPNQTSSNGPDNSPLSHNFTEAQHNYEERLAHAIETLLEQSLGTGKIRAEVNAVVDRSRTTENAEIFDPDSQVIRSSHSTEVGAPQLTNRQGDALEEGSRSDEAISYEISKTIRNEVREPGGISRLSVAVLVDGTYTAMGDGTKKYTPRTQGELDQLARLVRSAVGYDESRGDTVEVINMQFAAPYPHGLANTSEDVTGSSTQSTIKLENIALGLIALVIVIFGLRPIVNRYFSARDDIGLNTNLGLSVANGKPPIHHPVHSGEPVSQTPSTTTKETTETTLERKNVTGRMSSTSIEKIENIIDKKTNEAVSQVRGWLGKKGE